MVVTSTASTPAIAQVAHDPAEPASDGRGRQQHHLAGLAAAQQPLARAEQPRPEDPTAHAALAGDHL